MKIGRSAERATAAAAAAAPAPALAAAAAAAAASPDPEQLPSLVHVPSSFVPPIGVPIFEGPSSDQADHLPHPNYTDSRPLQLRMFGPGKKKDPAQGACPGAKIHTRRVHEETSGAGDGAAPERVVPAAVRVRAGDELQRYYNIPLRPVRPAGVSHSRFASINPMAPTPDDTNNSTEVPSSSDGRSDGAAAPSSSSEAPSDGASSGQASFTVAIQRIRGVQAETVAAPWRLGLRKDKGKSRAQSRATLSLSSSTSSTLAALASPLPVGGGDGPTRSAATAQALGWLNHALPSALENGTSSRDEDAAGDEAAPAQRLGWQLEWGRYRRYGR